MLRDTPATGEAASEVAGAEAPPIHPRRYPYARELVAGGLYVALLIVVLRLASAPLSNTDTYFHLRFGAEFLDDWSLRHPGSVSTFATADWLPTQWLSEVVMAQTERWGGLAAVAWLYGVVLVVLVTITYCSARRWCGPLLAAVLTLVALLTASQQLWMRPQLLSFVLVCVTATAWLRTRDDGRIRWWLVPLTWVWAMVHGMWPIGIGLGVVAVVGLALDRAVPRRELTRAAIVPLLSAAAAAATPVGPALYGAVLGVGSRSQYFSEWDSPDFTTLSCEALGILLVLAVGLAIRRQVRTWLDVGLLLVCGVCAVWSWRTVPVAAMILVPLVASLTRTGRDQTPAPRRLELGLLAGAGVVLLAVLAVLVPRTADDPPHQPSWVDPALSSLPAGTKVVDSWDYGGYLMWRYPHLDLLAHGYGDTFTVPELQRNTDILALAPGWDDELRRTGCTIAVLRPTALAYALEHQEHWKVLHRSDSVVELQAPPDWVNG